MMALPGPTAFTSALPLQIVPIFTTFSLDDDHVKLLSEASSGEIVTLSLLVSSTDNVSAELSNEISLIFIAVTLIEQVVETPLPSSALQVIVALPADLAVTSPLLLTVATDVLEELQLTLLSVALLGKTVALSCFVPPTSNVTEDVLRLILLTATFLATTSIRK